MVTTRPTLHHLINWPLTSILLMLLLAATSPGATVVFTTNTIISAGDPQYDGQDIVVRGCTVTINGTHSFNSLTVERNAVNLPGIVTHAAGLEVGVQLTIATNLVVQGAGSGLVASRIDVTGCGYPGGIGPGAGGSAGNRGAGGGHGGIGGTSATGATGGVAYGSWLAPSELGSGGGDTSQGGAGGGAIRLIVQGTATVNGLVVADGSAPSSPGGGGGAGGSIYLTAGLLAGSGGITANGGAKGSFGEPGGGGGGRIAIRYVGSTFSGPVSAIGGAGWAIGGAGTIYRKANSAAVGSVTISNAGNSGGWTPLTASEPFDLTLAGSALTYPTGALALRSLAVNTGAYLTSLGSSAVTLGVQQTMSIAADGHVTVSSRGYSAATGPGAGGLVGNRGAGGGHGGNGGNAATGAAGGTAYGSLTAPLEPGSGGGDPSCGGPGGGVLFATIDGTLTVDGELTANGGNASAEPGGGGAGGSLHLNVGTLAGVGTISANGGNKGAYGEPGGGGGGRIAIYYGANLFAGTLSVFGAEGSTWGGSGTLYMKDAALPRGRVWLNNNGHWGAATPLNVVNADLTIANAAWVYPLDTIHVSGDLLVGAAALITHLPGGEALEVSVAGAATIEATGAISANGKGYGAQSGPGAGGYYGNRGSGGGHGGRGGNNAYGGAGGLAYGSEDSPVDFGSGGGSPTEGGSGGGAIHLIVEGPLDVTGQITASGANAPGCSGGGGAGGSIWLETNQLSGTGIIAANGGASGCYGETGGGGGGRVAIYTCNQLMEAAHITASGGAGWEAGAPGTRFFGSGSIGIPQQPQDQTAFVGDNLTFTVTAVGDGSLSYRWRKNGVELQESVHFTGVHTSTLHINNVAPADQGLYDVWLVDNCGARSSEDAQLTVVKRGDLNNDWVVNAADFVIFAGCLGGPDVIPLPSCALADLDEDEDADLADFAILAAAAGAP